MAAQTPNATAPTPSDYNRRTAIVAAIGFVWLVSILSSLIYILAKNAAA